MENIINISDVSQIKTALSDLKGSGNIISFEKGKYVLGLKDTEKHLFDDCDYGIATGDRDVCFFFDGLENSVIDGNGSEFVFDDVLFPVWVNRCKNVTLKNFSIDFTFARFAQGVVTHSDNDSLEIEFLPDVRFEVDEGGHIIFSSGSYSFSTEDNAFLLLNTKHCCFDPWDYIFAGDYCKTKEGLATGYIETDASVVSGSRVEFTYRSGSKRLVFPVGETLIINFEPRDNIALYIDKSNGVNIQNVSIYRNGGMGIVGQSSNNVTIDGVHIMPKPGRGEMRSTTADGLFFTSCTGLLDIKNSEIIRTLDDGVNIHGLYTKVEKIIDKNTIKAAVSFFPMEAHRGDGLYEPYDILTFNDPETENEKFSRRLLECESLPGKKAYILKLDSTDGINVGDVIENPDRIAEVRFTNNYIHALPHVRVSGKKKIVVENNVFEEMEQLMTDDLFKYWYESGPVKDLIIRNNKFFRCPCRGGAYTINILTERADTTNARHKNVIIENNEIESVNNKAIYASCVDGLIIRGNKFNGKIEDMTDIVNCTDVVLQ